MLLFQQLLLLVVFWGDLVLDETRSGCVNAALPSCFTLRNHCCRERDNRAAAGSGLQTSTLYHVRLTLLPVPYRAIPSSH